MISFFLLSSIIILFLIWLLLAGYTRNQNLPPGPKGLPILGYYPFLTDKLYLEYAKLAKIYGNIFSYRTVGGKLVVVLNGIDLIKEIFINRSEEIVGRIEESNIMAWISDGLGIAQEEGSVWKEHRRFFLQTVKNFGFGKQESEVLIHREIRTLIHDLKEDAGKFSDVRFHIAYAVSSIVSNILFSKKFKKYGTQFSNIAESAECLLEMVLKYYQLVGPIFKYIVMKPLITKRLQKARDYFDKVIEEIITDHIKRFNPDNIRDYIDGYLYQTYKLDKSGEKHSFTMKRLHAISFNMLMEGTDSAASTIVELLDEASRHLDEQKLVQEELDSVVGRERLPSWTDKQKLIYLEAFIQELFRRNMAFNLSTLHCNYREITVNGFRIPRRTIIIANLWTINNDSLLYPEPSKFDPKRFIGEDGKRVKTEGPYPFGVGKRACIGESLAKMELFLIIAAILQNFTIYPTGQHGYLKLIPRE